MALPFILGLGLVIVHSTLPGVSARALEQFAARARRAAGVGGEVDVLITSSAQIRRLNRRFRGNNTATDVLSFPSGNGTAGDVAISAEIAARNARRLGHSPEDELKILILHGLLHLAGYDHENDGGEMARKEARMRRALGLPAALIERATQQVPSTEYQVPRKAAPRRPAARRSQLGSRRYSHTRRCP